jgi:hypothetical protein
MSSANDEGDNKLREAVAKNESRAQWGGAAVVFGLVIEVVLAATYPHGKSIIEEWGPVVADALVALGVAAEILFAAKARSKAEALQRLSDEKVSEANARAAEANQKAQEAILELAELRAPRALTPEQRGRIVDKLKPFSGTEYDIAVNSIDPEVLNFVFIVELILSTAGLTELNWQGPLTAQVLTREGRPFINLSASVTNVMIGVHVNQPPKHFECALALSDALMAEGIDATAKWLTPGPGSSTNANAIHIFIGRKI